MTEDFCVNCGHKRIIRGKFCAQCGNEFSSGILAVEVLAAELATEEVRSGTSTSSLQQIKNSSSRNWPNIIVNIIIGVALIMLNVSLERQSEIGGTAYYINQNLMFIIIFQVLSVFLQRRKKSVAVLLPGIIALISILPTGAMYSEYQEWLNYQGYNTQQIASGDLTLIAQCLVLFIGVAITNFVLLFISSKKPFSSPTEADDPKISTMKLEQQVQIKAKPYVTINLFLNIVIGILLYNWGSAVQEYLEWGYGDTQVAFFFILIAVFQIIVFGLERKNRSFYGAIPIMFALVGCFPTFLNYAELQSLIDSEGYSYLVISVADRVFMTFYFLLTAALIAINLYLMYKRWNDVKTIKPKIELVS